MIIIEVSFKDNDEFYSFPEGRVAELAALPLGEMVPFVVKHGGPVAISSTDEVDAGITEDQNCYNEVDEQELREELLELVG